MTKSLTEGNPFKLIIGFAVPVLFGLLFQQFYNLMDTMIVGRTLGADALAAVGATGSINFLIIGFCMGICSGFAIPMAQAFGAKNEHLLKQYIGNSIWLCIVFAIVLAVLTGSLCYGILKIMNTPEDIIDMSYAYIDVLFWGIPVTFLYNMTSSMIRSVGDSKTPVYFLVIASLINIALDLFLIIVAGMGVEGAAYATVISQGISGLLCLFYIIKKCNILQPDKEEMKLDMPCIKRLCVVGLPMGIQYSVTAIGTIVLQIAINGLGTLYVASMTAGNKMSMIFTCGFDALGTTIATYAGQNVGARRLDRVREGVKDCMIIGSVYSILVFLMFYFKGEFFASAFVDKSNVEVIKNARHVLVCFSAFYIPLCVIMVFRFCIQGMGYSRIAIIAGAFEMVARIFVAVFFVPYFGFNAVCFASPVAWVFADVFLIPCYYYCLKKTAQELAL